MPQYGFGVGLLTFTPAGSNPTPVVCGVLQDVTLKMSTDLAELYGQNKVAVAVAEAKQSIGGTAKFAQYCGSLIKAALNASIASGQIIGAINEPATIPGTPYQVTAANSATFSADLSVYDYTAGVFMTRVASGPATGQYSVSAGVYTFAAADTAHVIGINYSYTAVTGKTVTLVNQLMGAANTYTLTLFNNYNSMNSGIKLNAVTLGGMDFAFKNTDFTMQDIPFKAFADSSGNVASIYTAE